MTDRDFINAITHLLTKYRDQVREETLAEVRRKLIGGMQAPTSVPLRRGRPAGALSQRARIESFLAEHPWSLLAGVRSALPDVAGHVVATLVCRLVKQGKLVRRGEYGSFFYSLPLAIAAE